MKSDRDKFSIFYMGILTRPRSPVLSKGQIARYHVRLNPYGLHSDRQTLFFVRFGQLRDRQLETFLVFLFQVLIYGGHHPECVHCVAAQYKGVRKGRANIFLSVLLLALAFSISHILFAGVVLDHLSARVYSIGDPTFYLIAPLLWFYSCELTGLRIRFSWTLPFHFAPFFSHHIFIAIATRASDGHVSQFLAGKPPVP